MLIRLEQFGGLIPKISKRSLPKNYATQADRTQLYSTELRGVREPAVIESFPAVTNVLRAYRLEPDTISIDLENADWVLFDEVEVNFLRGPVISDAAKRHYWMGGDDGFRFDTRANLISAGYVANPTGTKVGVPWGNDAAPPVSPPVLGTINETRSYVYTLVNSYGEESRPSLPSDPDTGDSTGTWTIGSFNTTTDPGYDGADFIRIYRTITGAGSVDFRFVVELSTTTLTTYNDDRSSDAVSLEQALPSVEYDSPPTDLMGLVAMPNGMLVAFKENEIWFSEPYLPHAWPEEYVVALEHSIVGLGVHQSGLAVMTTANPYVASGTSPATMSFIKLDDVEPCLSFRSIVSADNGVYYASQNGLVLVTEYQAETITNPFITRNEWRSNYNPEGLRGAVLGSSYVGFYTDDEGFVFGPEGDVPGGVIALTQVANVDSLQNDSYSGEVYFIRSSSLFQWNPTTTQPLSYVWKSKEFETARPINFGAFKIKWEDVTGAELGSTADYTAFNEWRSTTEYALGAANRRVPLNPINFTALNAVPRLGTASSNDIETTTDQTGPPPYQNSTSINGSPLDYTDPDAKVGVVFTVFANGEIVYSQRIVDEQQHRLPSGYKADIWQFELAGYNNVYSVNIAETGKELASG